MRLIPATTMNPKAALFLFFILYATLSGHAQHLTVMTYNIRLDYAGDGKNAWGNRRDELVSQIRFYEPDVFGIQEGLPNQVDYLDSALAAYDYIGVGREDGKRAGEFSALFYKKDQFKLLESGTFWLSETPEKPSTGWDAALPRICTYGLFQMKKGGKKFRMFNTHFDHVGREARVNSMKLILDRIQAYQAEKLPTILTGDLNVTPDEAPILELKTRLSDAREVAEVVFGPDATFNGFKFDQTPQNRIDYIAVNKGFSVLKYAVLTDSFDQKYISDHFAVFCELEF